MRSNDDLKRILNRIDQKGYKAYKDIQGAYDFGNFELLIDYVQGDPFAAPSRIRARLEHDMPPHTFSNKSLEVALRDFLTRQFAGAIKRHAKGQRGSGKSGRIGIDKPGQEILERTAVLLNDQWLEARFTMGLPAFGRKIAGSQAQEMFFNELPRIAQASLFFNALDTSALEQHLLINEDADFLRNELDQRNLIGFIADGAILPRTSEVDPLPMKNAIPFQSPDRFRMEIELPNRTVTGMGIPKGITLIVGGGYHGKSTLLNALQFGIYNHIPNDGRELVVTAPNAVKIRAEDGRNIVKTDISPFITRLPLGKDTRDFYTENASGSTSQAANTIEALESGSRVLLIDEDTSATNFMIRDTLMKQLIPKDYEPITPYIGKARQLFEELGVSTILVIGGSGAYFNIAHHIIAIKNYLPHDVTKQAHDIARASEQYVYTENDDPFVSSNDRVPDPSSLNPRKGKKIKIGANGIHGIQFGRSFIDLRAVEQLVDASQTRAIGSALFYATQYMGKMTLSEILDKVMADIEKQSLDVLSQKPQGEFAMFRRQELAFALNRLRTLRMK